MSTQNEENNMETQPDARKVYIKPEIVHELELETRAGSPLGLPDPLNMP